MNPHAWRMTRPATVLIEETDYRMGTGPAALWGTKAKDEPRSSTAMRSHESKHESGHGTGWQVTKCACGHLTLRLGTVRIDFTPAEFAQLERLVAQAMRRFEVESGHVAVLHNTPLTH
jgi:hypothetical protein